MHSWVPPSAGGCVQQHPVQAPPELGSQQYPKLSIMPLAQQIPPGSNTPLAQHSPWASRRQGVQVGKVGPLKPRRAASVPRWDHATPVSAAAPRPSAPFSSARRLRPDASERENRSKSRSSMIGLLRCDGYSRERCVARIIAGRSAHVTGIIQVARTRSKASNWKRAMTQSVMARFVCIPTPAIRGRFRMNCYWFVWLTTPRNLSLQAFGPISAFGWPGRQPRRPARQRQAIRFLPSSRHCL
jgi:hypothetical protein